MLSSAGSLLSFTSVFYFIFLIWEALASQRPLLSPRAISSSSEWPVVAPRERHGATETYDGWAPSIYYLI